jgi:hypothetical protein
MSKELEEKTEALVKKLKDKLEPEELYQLWELCETGAPSGYLYRNLGNHLMTIFPDRFEE